MTSIPSKIANTTEKRKRVQLKHIQIDHDFFEKPKIKAVRFKFGNLGLLLLIDTFCDMGKATNGEVDEDCIRQSSKNLGLENNIADEFISYCIERGIFDRGSKPYLITNRRIVEDQESMASKQEEWRIRKGFQRDKQETIQGQVRDNLETSTGRMNNEDMNIEDLNTELDLKKNCQPPEIPKLPPGFIQKSKHGWISEIEFEQFCVTKGLDFIDRCFELLDGWVEDSPDPIEVLNRKKRAKNASALFQNWIFNRVGQEKSQAERARAGPKLKPKETNHERNLRTLREMEI